MPVELFVNGTLMRGLALHHNLGGATFLGAFRTAPIYRLYSIADVHPGMFEVESGGVSVAGEMYRMSEEVGIASSRASRPTSTKVRSSSRTAVASMASSFRAHRPKAGTRTFSGFGDWRAYIATLPRR